MPARSPEALFARYLAKPASRRRLAAVVEAFRDVVYGAALRLTGNESDAADIVHDVFLQLMTRPPAPGTVDRPAGYLTYRVLTLTARAKRTAQRRRARERVAVERLMAAAGEDGVDTEAVLQAIAALPERQRQSIELSYLLDCTRREIAEALGVSERTVANDLAAARETLGRRLGKVALAGALTPLVGLPLSLRAGAALSSESAVAAPLALVRELERLVRCGDLVAAASPASVSTGVSTAMAGGVVVTKTTTALLLAGVGIVAGLWLLQPRAPAPLVEAPSEIVSPVKADAPATIADETPPPVVSPSVSTAVQPVDVDAIDDDLDVAGFVRDAAGDPIVGATVTVREERVDRVSDLTLGGHVALATARTTTAVDGSFVLRLERGEETHVRAAHPDYGTGFAPNAVAGKVVEITLYAAARLEVVTVDEAGAPVRDVRVRMWRRSELDSYDHHKARTGEPGDVRVEGLAPGKMYVSVSHDRLGSPAWQFPVLEAGETTTVEFVLLAGRTLHGAVVDADTGDPIPEARIGAGWTQSREQRSDAEGRYEFPGWTGVGVDALVVTAEGYGRVKTNVGASDEINFELTPAYAVRGRVVGPDGHALADVRVSAMASQFTLHGQESDSESTRSGEDGEFEFVSLNRKWPYTITIQAEGLGRYLIDVDASLAYGGPLDLGDVVLPVGRRIEGVVIGDDGDGLTDATIELEGHNSSRGALREGKDYAVYGYVGTETRKTDDVGRFRFPDLSPGTYTLRVRLEGRQPLEETVELTANDDVLGVRLESGGMNSTLIVLRDTAGVPVVDGRVFVFLPEAGERLEARTDEDGVAKLFHREEIIGAVYRVRVPKGYLPKDTSGKLSGESEITVVLRRSAQIAGAVVDSDGAAIADRPLQLVENGRVAGEEYTDEQGRFRIDAEAGKTFHVRLGSQFESHEDGMTKFVEHHVSREIAAPAEDVKLVAESRPLDGVLNLRVVDEQGNAVPGALVTSAFLGLLKGDLQAAKADKAGRLRFDGLPHEPVDVSDVRAQIDRTDGYFLYTGAKKLTPTVDGREIVVQLARHYIVSGGVLGTDGKPVGGLELQIVRADGTKVKREKTHPNGFFGFPLAGGQTYTLVAELGETRASVTVDGPVHNLKMQLSEQ